MVPEEPLSDDEMTTTGPGASGGVGDADGTDGDGTDGDGTDGDGTDGDGTDGDGTDA